LAASRMRRELVPEGKVHWTMGDAQHFTMPTIEDMGKDETL